MRLPGTARTLATPLFPEVCIRTLCDLGALPRVATSRFIPSPLPTWDPEVAGTTGEKAVPGVKAPGERCKRENGCRRG